MIIMRFPEGKRKALTLSYDDGVEQDRTLLDILNAAGLKCTFNLNSGCFPPEGHVWPEGQIHRRMTRSAVQALYGAPHEVAVHTLTHPDLTQLPMNLMVREIGQDRINLEEIFGGVIRGAAYPFGTYSDETVQALESCGIVYCRTVNSSHDFAIPQDWLRLRPTCHHDDPMLDELCSRFLEDSAYFNSKLFYLWGHAYEFEANDNWQRIRDFAAKMGGHEDIWYCTNIEVYDYIAAWKQLLSSADGRTFANPTATDLWAEENGRVFAIPAGKTVKIS